MTIEYNYIRKSFRPSSRGHHESEQSSPADDRNGEIEEPRNGGGGFDGNPDPPGCSCDLCSEDEVANILHKKCPVITLAQQQLNRLLVEGDNFINENPRCRSFSAFYTLFKNIILGQDKHKWFVLLMLIAVAFTTGLLIGAASCGSYLGRFNSPILTCIDNYFVADVYGSLEDSYRAIV